MNLAINVLASNLKHAVGIALKSVSSRSTLPVLANVLLKSDNGRLMIASTNLEMTSIVFVGAKVVEDGAITIPAKTFSDLVGQFADDDIVYLQCNRTVLEMTCGETKSNIKGISAEEFPILTTLIEKEEGIPQTVIETDVLTRMISQVGFAAAKDETRPSLTGINLTVNGSFKMAATDGFRLAVHDVALMDTGVVENMIIPAKVINEVGRIARTRSDLPLIPISRRNSNTVVFDMGDVIIASQLIDGKYPDYQPIIPTRTETSIEIDAHDLAPVCNTVNVMARNVSNTGVLDISQNDDGVWEIEMSANSAETGDIKTVGVCSSGDGNAIRVCMNTTYLKDVITAIGNRKMKLSFTNSLEPIVVGIADDDAYKCIIMPMHHQS